MQAVETRVVFGAPAQLADRPVAGGYDLAHLQRIHRHLFGDVYGWAGEIRTVALAKSEMFALPQFIESYANESLCRLADDGTSRASTGTSSSVRSPGTSPT